MTMSDEESLGMTDGHWHTRMVHFGRRGMKL